MTGETERPKRILMTCDAVGGVWRYAVDLAESLTRAGHSVVLAVLGPTPNGEQRREAAAVATLVELDLPLDWMVEDAGRLEEVPARLAALADEHGADLVHLNLPSQAAGFPPGLPVLVVSHSCTVTWFAAVRGTDVPAGWQWQKVLNRAGLDRADCIVAPSASHADLLRAAYGSFEEISVVHNGSAVPMDCGPKDHCVFAAGRWWDDGKNARVLDEAAPMIRWPVIMAGARTGPNGQTVEIRNAQFRGEQPHDQAMAMMRRAAIFVSPSLYEPFGLVGLEAARSGSALVLADIPIYRELWDGCAAFFAPHDAAALAREVNALAADDRLRAQRANAAQLRAARYTIEAQAAGYLRLYDALRGPIAFNAAAAE
jgi:glycosyltransferase involved in cell wall biosynthesis